MFILRCSTLHCELYRIHFSGGVTEYKVIQYNYLNVAYVIFVSATVEERGDKSARLQ